MEGNWGPHENRRIHRPAVPLAFIVMLAIERIWPARAFPKVSCWHWIGIGLFVYAGVMNALLPRT